MRNAVQREFSIGKEKLKGGSWAFPRRTRQAIQKNVISQGGHLLSSHLLSYSNSSMMRDLLIYFKIRYNAHCPASSVTTVSDWVA